MINYIALLLIHLGRVLAATIYRIGDSRVIVYFAIALNNFREMGQEARASPAFFITT